MILFTLFVATVVQQCAGRNLPMPSFKLINSENGHNSGPGNIEGKEPGRGGRTTGWEGMMTRGSYDNDDGYGGYGGYGNEDPSRTEWAEGKRTLFGRRRLYGYGFRDNDDFNNDGFGQGVYGQPMFSEKQNIVSQVLGPRSNMMPGPVGQKQGPMVGRPTGYIENIISTLLAPFISITNSLTGKTFGQPGEYKMRP